MGSEDTMNPMYDKEERLERENECFKEEQLKSRDVRIKMLSSVKEAQDSFKILISHVGYTSAANALFLRWPDAFQAYLENETNYLNQDIFNLICEPIKILALSVLQRCESEKIICEAYSKEIEQTLKNTNPIEVKKNLIRIIDIMIHNLRQKGIKIQYIKE